MNKIKKPTRWFESIALSYCVGIPEYTLPLRVVWSNSSPRAEQRLYDQASGPARQDSALGSAPPRAQANCSAQRLRCRARGCRPGPDRDGGGRTRTRTETCAPGATADLDCDPGWRVGTWCWCTVCGSTPRRVGGFSVSVASRYNTEGLVREPASRHRARVPR
jgi:hypothetical protein